MVLSSPPAVPFGPGVYAILDLPTLKGRPPLPAAEALLAGGAVALQLRAKGALEAAAQERLARDLARLCHNAGVPFLVNDDPGLAGRAGAAGVHLGQEDLDPAVARNRLGPGACIGLSTHGLGQVRAAAGAPVDYLGFGPVFHTATKRQAEPTQGLDGLAQATAATCLPVVAIGGITPERMAAVARAGAHAVAAIGALLGPGLARTGLDPVAIRRATETASQAFHEARSPAG